MLKKITKKILLCIIIGLALTTTIGCSLNNKPETKDPILAKLEAVLNQHNSLARSVSNSDGFKAETKMSIDYDCVTDNDLKFLKGLTDTELNTYVETLAKKGAISLVRESSNILKGAIDSNGYQSRAVEVVARASNGQSCIIYMNYKVSFKDNNFIDGDFVNSYAKRFSTLRYRSITGSVTTNNSSAEVNSLGAIRERNIYIVFDTLVTGKFTDTEPF